MKKAILPLFAILVTIFSACTEEEAPKTPLPEQSPPPTIQSFSPDSGSIGTEVTITGVNFGQVPIDIMVSFGGIKAELKTASSTKIIAFVPEGATTAKIKVQTVGGSAQSEFDFTVVNEPVVNEPDVYVAGWERNVDDIAYPKIWKNNELLDFQFNYATSVFLESIEVVGDDIYVVGDEYNPNPGINTARLWKNGEEIPLTINGIESSFVRDIAIEGEDVYVSGSYDVNNFRVGTIWKNGMPFQDLSPNSFSSNANAIYLSGTDIYAAGHNIPQQGETFRAAFWKNGVVTNLTDGSTIAIAYGIYVNENDIYVVGNEINDDNVRVAMLWKNGTPTTLTDGTKRAHANDVFVDGNNVYIAGFERNAQDINVAKIWKNGVATNLTDGTSPALSYKVLVNGDDIYAVGFEHNEDGIDVAKVWKNGVASNLTSGISGDGRATSIVIK